jgi:hypothetical protein
VGGVVSPPLLLAGGVVSPPLPQLDKFNETTVIRHTRRTNVNFFINYFPLY